MRFALGIATSLVLAGCAGLAPAPSPSAPPPATAKPPATRAVPRIAQPVWTPAEAVPGEIRAEGVDTIPDTAPDRLSTDLADAAACGAVGAVLAARAARVLPNVAPAPSAAEVSRVRSALTRAQYPGCRILERSTTVAGGDHRIRWSLAVLDTSESLLALRRELSKLDSTRASTWSRRVLGLP